MLVALIAQECEYRILIIFAFAASTAPGAPEPTAKLLLRHENLPAIEHPDAQNPVLMLDADWTE
jgi:hypothetical protein